MLDTEAKNHEAEKIRGQRIRRETPAQAWFRWLIEHSRPSIRPVFVTEGWSA